MSAPDISITLCDQPIDPSRIGDAFARAHNTAGAIVSFTGNVRSEGERVSRLSIECYRAMAEAEISRFTRDAAARWSLQALSIHHRIGDMAPGEAIVHVIAASAHRRDAFAAVDFMMDYLKSEAPFWKKEIFNGEARWIEPRTEDIKDKLRWRAAE